MEGWQKLLAMAGGAAAVGAVLYYLLRDESEAEHASLAAGSDSEKKGGKPFEVTKARVLQILDEIMAQQELMKERVKGVTQGLVTKSEDFMETYGKIKAFQMDDVLEKHGLTMQQFDQMLHPFERDPEVAMGINKLMGGAAASAPPSEKVQSISFPKLIEAHKHMLTELQSIVSQFSKTKGDTKDIDAKTVALTAQVIIGAKVEQKYGLSQEDMESAVMLNFAQLQTDKDFTKIGEQMQALMTQLLVAAGGNPGSMM